MERNEISIHEVRVYRAFTSAPEQWLTAADIVRIADVAPRTARAHCLKLVRLGILDQAEVFPSHRYRLAKLAKKRNVGYVQRLEQASEVFDGEARG